MFKDWLEPKMPKNKHHSVHGVTVFTDLVKVVSGLYYCSSNTFQGSSVCCLREQWPMKHFLFLLSQGSSCDSRGHWSQQQWCIAYETPIKAFHTFVFGFKQTRHDMLASEMWVWMIKGCWVNLFSCYWAPTVKHLSVRCSSLRDSFQLWPW